MSTYDNYEISAYDGGPVEGYQFVGSRKSYRFTNAQKDVFINGLLFKAAEIKRTGIKSGTHEDQSNELELELPFSLDLIQDYAFSNSPPSISVTIYRYHEDTNPAIDWVVVWKGSVTGFTVQDGFGKLRIPSVFDTVLRGSIPSVFYQNICNHVLYDSRCKVNRPSFQTVTTISVVSSTTITVVDDGAVDSYLRAGEMVLVGKSERRLIIDNVADVITVNFPFDDALVGDTVQLAAGCDHAYQGDCKNKFSNTLNYGGFPYVPNNNPFEQTQL